MLSQKNMDQNKVTQMQCETPLSTFKKLKILITVTDTEKVEPESNYHALFSQFNLLALSQRDFDQFLVTVRIDLMTKTEELRKIKSRMSASRMERSCALVHLFMLNQYTSRLTKFEEMCRKSLSNIGMMYNCGENVEDCVATHLAVLVKMKRRMKQMLDVSEKCVVVELIDTANDLKELCDEMETSVLAVEKDSRLCRSTLSLEPEIDDERPRPRNSVSECLSSTIGAYPSTSRKKRTFKTISEHVIVITKSFTARK